ncbi:MAG: lipoprotein insertase outer membrane protein LolB [Methylotetracoccus sp.]|jgi:outer membrane lipoprotein LolB|nr:lipoprotein insertase outer membrane protein LolB [Methylotetracoccus sp.]
MAAFRLKLSSAAVWFLLILLSACAGVTPPPSTGMAKQVKLAALTHWRLEGRIAVQTPDDAFQASLFWEHERQQDRVRVSGPFSQGTFSIILQDDLIFIRDSSGNTKSSRNVPALLQQELGFAVPLSSLRYWVLGVPAPSVIAGQASYDQGGLLRQLRQDGWRLDFQSFVPAGDYLLPQKLAAQGRDLKLKLFVDDWVIVR